MWGKTTQYDETDTPYSGSERNLDANHDVAYQQWGGDWHMPTEEQITELIQYTRYERTSGNDYGKYISQEDSTKYITFPFSGYYLTGQPASTNATASGISGNAFFWSSTNLSEDTTNTNAKFLSIGSYTIGYMPRSYGLTIRPVLDKKKVKNQINFNIRPNWSQTLSSAPDGIINKPNIYSSSSINLNTASPLLASSSTVWYYDTNGIKYQSQNGSTSAIGNATLSLGNATASGVSGNKQGKLVLYSTGTYSNTLNSANLTANRTLSLPNEDGTLATQAYVTSSMPTVNNGTLSISGPSGSSTITTDVFHANQSGDSLIAFSPGTNTTINVNSSTRTITIGTTAEPNVQSNWNETDTSSDAYILNKPTIPDITGKADKVTGAVSGNFAALDSNGNLVDSGHKHTDYSVVTFRTWT